MNALGRILIVSLWAAGCAGAPEEAIEEEEQALGLLGEAADSLEGLPGTYRRSRWLTPLGQMSDLTLREGADGVHKGTFTRTLNDCAYAGCTEEEGEYNAVPTNPAIGSAFIILRADGGETSELYFILRIWRAATGEMSALLLQRLYDDDRRGVPFTLYRSALPQ